MNIDNARNYLKTNFKPEFHNYINNRLASDFAVSIAKKIAGNKEIKMDKLKQLKIETFDLIRERNKLEIKIKRIDNFIHENLADIAELKLKED